MKMIQLQLLHEIYQPAPYCAGDEHPLPRRFRINTSDILLVDLSKLLYAKTFSGILETLENNNEEPIAVKTTFIELCLANDVKLVAMYNDDLLSNLIESPIKLDSHDGYGEIDVEDKGDEKCGDNDDKNMTYVYNCCYYHNDDN